ncbi:MAG: Ribosome maturation factor RimP [Chroococcopsis gigantea SAG 12.99]|jgi:ribosome maturation factor RimP|nr:ribosome maturation factor RimP [Chlorogloea purpurea SAG 13.99]MDV2999501.1 Ribosome maturation factor RimP [Chroococcopsis gigantea SAG 12.99]
MTHPLVPTILELAAPIAESLGLEIVEVVLQTNKRPPVLRVDIRNPNQDTGLNDCEQMSRSLETSLETGEIIPFAYVLEISSPGISRQLDSDREFDAFKGFAVIVTTTDGEGVDKQWRGKLKGRDESSLYLNQKGRELSLPRSEVVKVQLDNNP